MVLPFINFLVYTSTIFLVLPFIFFFGGGCASLSAIRRCLKARTTVPGSINPRHCILMFYSIIHVCEMLQIIQTWMQTYIYIYCVYIYGEGEGGREIEREREKEREKTGNVFFFFNMHI